MSATVDKPVKPGHGSKKENEGTGKNRKIFNSLYKKHKQEESRNLKFSRKRLQSFPGNGKSFPPYKRRKKDGMIIPPTKFLLGGNIHDPLNLNSMQNEEINKAMNAITPQSSPLPTPKHRREEIELLLPPNSYDPLNLNNDFDEEEYALYTSGIKSPKRSLKRKNRKRKRASSTCGKESDIAEAGDVPKTNIEEAKLAQELTEKLANEAPRVDSSKLQETAKRPQESIEPVKTADHQKEKTKLRIKLSEEPKDKRLRKVVDNKDKIVSPVVPQPGAWKSRKEKIQQMPTFKPKNAKFAYGNYNRYYGYRNPHHELDTRLTVFSQRKELFTGKDILDIGCNIGHVTLSVARDFGAKSVTGIDIDKKLIGIARKNIKHYVNCVQSPTSNEDVGPTYCDTNIFPMSMPATYGPIDVPGFTKINDNKGFPYNINFVQGNYVLEDDALLSNEQPQFDTILCLSMTKWLHLNYGDAGLKQVFKRMYAQLRAGGILILEPQNWSTYGKRKALTEKIYKNYQSIEFMPHKFTQYLLSSEVGFQKCEVLSRPSHPSKGFQRPIYLFTKSDSTLASLATNIKTPTTVQNENQCSRDSEQSELEQRTENELCD